MTMALVVWDLREGTFLYLYNPLGQFHNHFFVFFARKDLATTEEMGEKEKRRQGKRGTSAQDSRRWHS